MNAVRVESPVTVRVCRFFDQPVERVFDAWLDPRIARKFLFATPDGKMVHVEIDPRQGGDFLMIDRRDGVDVRHIGTFVEIDRPHRLEFDFSVPYYSTETTRVSIGLVRLERGCELILSHEDVVPELASKTEEGWKMILDALEEQLS
jgi:uncharacterized protein YndB with AHSA1/START domain